MPYSGMTSKEVCATLGMSRQMFKQSGLSERITKAFPFGPKFPLYDDREVSEWRTALLRRRGMIALGRWASRQHPLIEAPLEDDRYDVDCPTCGGWAMGDPLEADEYLAAITAGRWPTRIWCPKCGIQNVAQGNL
jgi:hypothetical protein